MDRGLSSATSRRFVAAILRPSSALAPVSRLHSVRQPPPIARKIVPIRRASTTADPTKPIVLEEPDKFRPPSHPQRLRRRPPRHYGPALSENELAAQKTKQYPHMFPNEGTFMHWFLTNRVLHVWITLGTLSLLAIISLFQTFLQTSPFAHLIPPLSTLPWHPWTYTSEFFSVLRLHMDYTTEQTAEKRRQNILDAQKRRLYRRAHGIENPDAAEEHGIDVRGLVPWDDGLTAAERALGGRDPNLTTRMIHEMKTRGPDGKMVYVRDLLEMRDGKLQPKLEKDEEGNVLLDKKTGKPQEVEALRRGPRYFGIWG